MFELLEDVILGLNSGNLFGSFALEGGMAEVDGVLDD